MPSLRVEEMSPGTKQEMLLEIRRLQDAHLMDGECSVGSEAALMNGRVEPVQGRTRPTKSQQQ